MDHIFLLWHLVIGNKSTMRKSLVDEEMKLITYAAHHAFILYFGIGRKKQNQIKFQWANSYEAWNMDQS